MPQIICLLLQEQQQQKQHIGWNRGGTIPKHQKEINRQMMKKRYENGLDVRGANNPRAKTWKIVFIGDKELTIKSIHDWAKKEGYSKSGIRNLRIGKWKRYKDIVAVEELSQQSIKGASDAL